MIDEIRLLDLVTLGRFNEGVPYIDMNVEGDLFSIFQRQIAGTMLEKLKNGMNINEIIKEYGRI